MKIPRPVVTFMSLSVMLIPALVNLVYIPTVLDVKWSTVVSVALFVPFATTIFPDSVTFSPITPIPIGTRDVR